MTIYSFLSEHWKALVAALGGGGSLMAWVKYWNGRGDKAQESIVDMLRMQLEQAQKEKEALQLRLDQMQADINMLMQKVTQFETIHSVALDIDPSKVTPDLLRAKLVAASNDLDALVDVVSRVPGIVLFVKKAFKDSGGDWRIVMLAFNQEYERLYVGRNKDDYKGRQDHAFWPDEIADEFRKNDIELLEGSFLTVNVREPVNSLFTATRGYFYGKKTVIFKAGYCLIVGTGFQLNPDGTTNITQWIDALTKETE